MQAAGERYTLRRDEYGTWSVIDGEIDFPVVVREKLLVCLEEAEAGDAAGLLNMAERLRAPPPATACPAPPKRHPFLDPIR